MRLKAMITSEEFGKLPEALQEAYTKQEDGSYLLDVEDKGYKAKLDEFRQTNNQRQKKIEELEKAVQRFEGVDPERYQEAVQVLETLNKQEEAELLKAGKIDEVVKRRTQAKTSDLEKQIQELTKANKKLNETTSQYRTQLGTLKITTGALAAIQKVGQVRKGAQDDIESRAHRAFRLDEKGEVITDLIGKDGESRMTFEEWAESLMDSAPHLFESAQGGGAGGGTKDKGSVGAKMISNDPVSIGRSLKEVAKGSIKVQMQGA